MHRLFDGLEPAFASPEDFRRARQQWLAGLVNLGRHTVSGTLTTAGLQHQDWSASYRSLQRLPIATLFEYLQQQTVQRTSGPWVVAFDDSCTRKTGRKIPGCAWRRDPLSPPFNVNLSWGQRVLQFSAALPASDGSARLVPVDWCEAPTPHKPGRHATAADQAAFREAKRQANLNVVAREHIARLRAATDRTIHFVCDGRFTNRTVLRTLPAHSALIGRIRRDTQLYAACSPLKCEGRPRRYGTALPSPDELRADDTTPWQTVPVHAGGALHQMRVKGLTPVMARITGVDHPVQVVVIAPLGYRLRNGGKLLYRQPAFLLCTDPDLPVQTVVQEYIWRWDIEVNFRDEKTQLGVTEAQLRQPEAAKRHPASAVAAYALLLLAACDCYAHDQLPPAVPLPKWRRRVPPRRASTGLLLNQLRAELWSRFLGTESLSQLSTPPASHHNPDKPLTDLASAVLYCRN